VKKMTPPLRGGGNENHTLAGHTRIITTLPVSDCDHCGENLDNVPSGQYERRTKIDILFEKTVEDLDAEIKTCPNCKTAVKAAFPCDITLCPMVMGFMLSICLSAKWSMSSGYRA